MKILLISIGTRGDMEPFLAIGSLLASNGHQVAVAFPQQFESLAFDADMPFYSLGSEFLDLIESEDGKRVMGGKSGFKKIMATLRLARKGQPAQDILALKQKQAVDQYKPDLIIHHSKAAYPLIWEVLNPKKTVMVSPVPYLHYVEGHSHLGFNRNFGPFFNKLTYTIADWGLVQFANRVLKKLKIKEVTKDQVKRVLKTHKVIYTISPKLFTGDSKWPKNLHILGYHERNKTRKWQPSSELETFISTHSKILLITFGSMGNLNPKGNTQLLVDVVEKHQIPTIINTAGGGLIRPESYDANLIHFVSRIPYDWIFPKVYAVIHHGGSGTTHTALKYGCASMLIPHIIDQFVWNKMVASQNCGPLGIPISKVSFSLLEPKLLDLWGNSSYKAAAEKIGEAMRLEDLEDQLLEELTNP